MSENNFPHIFGWKTVEKNSSPISLSQNPISLSARPYLLPLCSTLSPSLLDEAQAPSTTLSPSLLDEDQAPSTTLSPSLLDEALHNHLVCPSLSLSNGQFC